MRVLVWLILLFATAVAIALVARFSNGNVAILWPPYRIDLSVNITLAMLAVTFLLLHLLLVGIGKAIRLSERVREYRESRLRDKAHHALAQSLLAWFEGRFGRAERLAKEAQAIPQTSSLASLIGARAAHRMRQYDRRDEWLAQVNDPAARNARLLSAAELLVEEQRPADALQAISEAQQGGSRHIHSLRIALRAHEQSGDAAQVIRLVQQLDKRDALHPIVSQQYRVTAYRKLIAQSEAPGLNKLWNEIRSQSDIRSRLVGVLAEHMGRHGQITAATSLYEFALDEEFNAAFVRRYLANESLTLPDRLKRVEQWQKKYGDEPELLTALGELCRRERLWGKAKSYLEQSIQKQPSARAHYALAQVFEETEGPELAQTHFRLAADLAMADGDRL